jgi:hypothetical protein
MSSMSARPGCQEVWIQYELAQFQIDAAERRRLLELGKIRIDPAPTEDMREFTRQVQAAASSPRRTGSGER